MKLGTEKITMFSLLRANTKTAKPSYLKYWPKAGNWQIWEQIFKRIHDWVSGRFPEQKYGKRSILYSQGKVILAKRMVNHEFSGPSWLKKMDRVLGRSILKKDIRSHKPQLGRTWYVFTRTQALRNSWKQTIVIITKRACCLCSHNAILKPNSQKHSVSTKISSAIIDRAGMGTPNKASQDTLWTRPKVNEFIVTNQQAII